MIRAAATSSRENGPPIVGIGASAGGLEALKAFFGAMPSKTGLAFVVVVHLDPTHDSLMAELLSHVTGLSVEQAQDGQRLEPDHVYVVPPNRMLTIGEGRLQVLQVADRRSLRGVIDHFFRSLAAARHDRAVAIVLSGTGTEGALGAQAIKAQGGLVMAQLPDTAAQPGMPANVIATGLADLVLAPDRMPEALLDRTRHKRPRTGRSPTASVKPQGDLSAVLSLLLGLTKHDFRGYKRGTLQRRIERRMALRQIESISRYVELLRSDPAEASQLSKDLLIGVTSFFRDPPAFAELGSKVLGPLVRKHEQDMPIRIWVPGCSTGEEAYSIAIVLAEQMEAAQCACRVHIFATDLDADALEIARTAAYPESIALDVSPQRLRRFFTHEDGRYRINKSIREWVVFAAQNLTADPPFSKLDLVSCRNVLIYLEPAMQAKLISLFHFALNCGGYLFLGSAEGVGRLEELFTPLSKRRRIFRRIGPGNHLPLQLGLRSLAATDSARVEAKIPVEPALATLADRLLLDHFVPAAVVVRSNGHIVRFYGAMERYIALPKGEATLDVLTLARDALKPTLRAALHEAVRANRPSVLEAVDGGGERKETGVRVTVKPLSEKRVTQPLWVIIFEPMLPPAPVPSRRTGGGRPDLVRRLEAELRATKKEQLQLVEHLEHSNEELKAANEEVLSMNEELQSTNEELTTSKEELQSMNEELTTLNTQLQDKVHELTAVNDDLANLLVSTDIATVFLDTDLRIKRFTTAASHILNLQESDTGRPMRHIASNLVDVNLSGDARTVLEAGTLLEHEVASRDGEQYFLRVLPYRSEGHVVKGVVLTLVDVTALKQTERDLRAAREELAEDLRRMTRLHELSTELARPGDLHVLLQNVIRAAVDITSAEMGDIQHCDEAGVLNMAAHVGFEQDFLGFFRQVDSHTGTACEAAMSARRRVVVEDVTTSPIFANRASLPVMTAAGVGAVQSTPLFDRSGRLVGMFSTHYRNVHRFEEAELRWLDLLARHAVDVIERQRAEELLAQSHQALESRVSERTRWLSLMHDVSRAINEAATWDDALRKTLHRLCESEHWQIGFVYLPRPENPDSISPAISCCANERFRPFVVASEKLQYMHRERLPGRVYARNLPFWANDPEELLRALPRRASIALQAGLRAGAAFPINIAGEVIAVLEIFSDQPHPPTEQLARLMSDVSDQISRVLERERATARMADLVWSEQQSLLHTLHDSLGQTLTGLGMLSEGLRRRMTDKDSSTAETAEAIARQSQHALDQVRTMAKSLFPIEVEAKNLTAALRDLAAATEALHHIHVRVQGSALPIGDDRKVATELYRIAQEAVTNIVRHAKASTISIRLEGRSGTARLRIIDDGIGISEEPRSGMGLRIMRHRAASIGAALGIERAAKGTVVTCTLRNRPTARQASP